MTTCYRFDASRSTFLPSIFVLLCIASAGLGADKFKFSESLRDKMICDGVGDDRYCDEHFKGSVHINLKFAWPDSSSVTNIDETTTFNFSLGNLSISFSPGDDPKWAPGKRNATLLFTHINDSDRTVRDGRAVVRWNADGFSVSISGRTGFDLGPVLADEYIENGPGPIDDTAEIQIGFGDFMLDGTVDVTGQLIQHTAGPEDALRILNSVKLRGTLAPPAG